MKLGLWEEGPGLGSEVCVQTSLRQREIPSLPSFGFPLRTDGVKLPNPGAAARGRGDKGTREPGRLQSPGPTWLLFSAPQNYE